MSTTTEKLALFKYDPSTDGAQTFNIKQAMNDNWDKIDDAVKDIDTTLQNLKELSSGYYYHSTSVIGQNCKSGHLSVENILGNTVQDGTPTYDAPVDIRSVEGPLKLHVAGKNLVDLSRASATTASFGVTCAVDAAAGTMTLSGTCDRPGNNSFLTPFGSDKSRALYLPAGTYRISGLQSNYEPTSLRLYINCFNSANKTVGTYGTTTTEGTTFTLTTGAWCTVNVRVPDGMVTDGIVIYPQIEVGTEKTAFETYQGTSVGLPLLGTAGKELEPLRMAYGGSSGKKTAYYDSIVRINGVWFVERNVTEKDLTSASWSISGSYASPLLGGSYIRDGVESYFPVCTHFKSRGVGGSQNSGVWHGNSLVVGNNVMPNGASTTNEELKAFCKAQAEAGTPVTVIYALKTPVYEELHQDVQMLLNTLAVTGGVCSVWFEGDVLPSGADIGLPNGDYPCSGVEGAYRWLAELSNPLPVPTQDDLYSWALSKQRGGVFATNGDMTTKNVPEAGNLTGILSVTKQGEDVSMLVFGPTGKIHTATRIAGVWRGWATLNHPNYTEKPNGLYKITVDGTGHVSEAEAIHTGRAARFVVGTSMAGWTDADCDYLCDGTSDQTEINAAIAALPSGGGEVLLLDGTYNISSSITIGKANVSLRGTGPATILKRMFDGSGSNGVIGCSAANCCISDLLVDGNKSSYTSSNNRGVFTSASAANIKIDNVTVQNSYIGFGLSGMDGGSIVNSKTKICSSVSIFVSGASGISVEGCSLVTNGGNGITVETSEDIRIINNRIANTTDYGVYLRNGSKCGIITGNTIDAPHDDYSIGIYGSAISVIGNVVGSIILGGGSESNIATHNILTAKDVVNSGTDNTVDNNKLFLKEDATA